MRRQILIIKTGFSEFLDIGISTTVSLGDVLNCTAILHLYKNDHVTWITSWAARQLLENNPYIDQLLIFGPNTFKRIAETPFDVLINLEKDIGICSFLTQVKASKRYGFYFSEKKHDIFTHNPSTRYLLAGQENHKNINKTFLELLFEAVGHRWEKQGLVLSRKGKTKERFDVGFNYSVGTKWPTKAWPIDRWKKLEKLLKKNYSISWQKGHKNISQYCQWIDSCRVIVTSDSLGQVIGQAYNKKVITLFGPTNPERMRGIEDIQVIRSPLKCSFMPCYLPLCKNDKFCMDYIEPQEVAAACERSLL